MDSDRASMMEAPRGTIRLLVRERRGEAVGNDFVEWAVQALVAGRDGQALRVLAGLGMDGWASPFEAAEKFHLALRELGVAVPDPPSLLVLFAREVAGDVLEGRLEPAEAVARLHREVVSPFGHPPELYDWCLLWEGLDPEGHHSLEGEALDEAIRRKAREWAGRTT